MANKVVNLFVNGGKKYGHRIKADDHLLLLFLGDKGRNSVRGKKKSMASKVIKALKRTEHEGLLIVCEMNENFTSRVCHHCQQQSNENKKAVDRFSSRMVSLCSVLECAKRHHNWDRDHNASINILNFGFLDYSDMDRPEVLSRTMPYEPPSYSSLSSSSNELDDDQMEVDDMDISPSQQLNNDFLGLNL